MLNHKSKREEFYGPLTKEFWPDLYCTEYSLYDVYLMPQAEIEEIRLVTERVGKIFFKVAELLRKAPNKALWELDFPAETYDFIRTKTIAPESVIARIDLAKSELGGYRVLEINSDTPTFIKECFNINGLICKEFRAENPNEGLEEQLAEAVRKAILDSYKYIGGKSIPYIVFTSHGDHVEDRLTTEYLMELSGLVNVHYCPLDKLSIDDYAVYDDLGKKIDVLYRQTYPIEQLVDDYCDKTEVYVGQKLLQHVVDKKVAVVNPPSAFLLQSKGVQTVIWGLYDAEKFFSSEERKWIEDYMLPTYFEPDWFQAEKIPYVKKPCFGREGDTVEVLEYNGEVLHTNPANNYTESAPVFQEFCELPEITINTIEGKKEAYALVGCFLINGKASALGLRAGNMITDNLSYFLPVGVKK